MTNESIKKAFGRFWEHTVNKVSEKADLEHSHPWDEVGIETTYGDTITWDGDINGRTLATHTLPAEYDAYFARVSDDTPTLADFANGGEIGFNDGGTVDFTADGIVDTGNNILLESFFNFAVVLEDNVTITVPFQGINVTATFPKKGIYFSKMNGHITSLKINGIQLSTIKVTPVPMERLEPFEIIEVTTGGDTLTWDGKPSEYYHEGSVGTLYFVSSATPTMEDLANGVTLSSVANGQIETESLTSDQVYDHGSVIVLAAGVAVIVLDETKPTNWGSFEKKGVYFIKTTDGYLTSLTINGYTGFTTTESQTKIKTKYLPEHLQFGDNITITDVLTWDGNMEGALDISNRAGQYLVKLSDDIPTLEDLANGGTATVFLGGAVEILEFTYYVDEQGCLTARNDAWGDPDIGMYCPIILPTEFDMFGDGSVIVPKGVWSFCFTGSDDSMKPVSFKINGYTFVEGEIKSLDIKYLPEFLQPAIETAPKVLVENMTVKGSADGQSYTAALSVTSALIEEGKTYTLIVDGVTYTDLVATVEQHDGATMRIIKTPSGVPHVQAVSNASITATEIYFGDSTTGSGIAHATVTLIENNGKEKHVIKTQSLPKHLQFGESIIPVGNTLTWDGNIGDRYNVSLTVDNVTLTAVHIFDNIPTYEDLSKGGQLNQITEISNTDMGDGIFTVDNVTDMGDAVILSWNGAVSGAAVVVINKAGAQYDGITFEKAGIYFIEMKGGTTVVSRTVEFSINGYEFTEEVIEPLDIKYLPESHQFGDMGKTTYGSAEIVDGKLVWDGNTDGLISVGLLEGSLYLLTDDINVYKAKNGTISYFEGLNGTYTEVSSPFVDTGSMIPSTDKCIFFTNKKETISLAIVLEDNYNYMDLVTFPKKGIYVSTPSGNTKYPITLSVEGYRFQENNITKLDNKYLDVLETVGGDTLTWDGNTDGLECVTLDANYYKVSENVLTYEDLTGSWTVYTNNSGVQFTNENMYCSQIDDNTFCIGDPSGMMLVIFVTTDIKEGDLSVSKGIYFRKNEGEYYPTSLTINGYNGFVKEQVKEEYLPANTIFYTAFPPDGYIYKDVGCTNKVTKNELIEASKRTSIRVFNAAGGSMTALSISVSNDGHASALLPYSSTNAEAGKVNVTYQHLHTAEYTG